MPRLAEQIGLLVLQLDLCNFVLLQLAPIRKLVFLSLFFELVRVDNVNFLTLFSKLKVLKLCSRTCVIFKKKKKKKKKKKPG